MSDRPKAPYPTAPIAWMSQAYDTASSTPASPINRHEQYQASKPAISPSMTSMNPSTTMNSFESFDRPESPTLPPEQGMPCTEMELPTLASNSMPNSPKRYDFVDTSMPPAPPPPNMPFQPATLNRLRQDVPPLPAVPNIPPYDINNNSTNNTNAIKNNPSQSHHRHHHHHHHKSSKRPVHMSDHMAASIELSISPNVAPAPAAGMYWSRALTYGRCPSRPLRAHSSNLIGEYLYVFGGCDMKTCFNTLYILDMDTLTWSKPRTFGQLPPPCRAHSCTTVERDLGAGKNSYSLYMFGGGDGPNYFNDLYVLNIDTLTWTKPKTEGEAPSPRRAHTTCIWNQKIIIVGGGDGARALADVHMLDVSDPTLPKWSLLHPEGTPPIARGYHTSNLVKDKLIVYGGSDGHECFGDVYVLDLASNRWYQIDLDRAVPRLAHSATQVGSYIFVVGGHDGSRYSSEVLLLNLVTMSWETRKIYGGALNPRGYHTSVLHDSRLYILGGYDGRNVFDDVYILELSACAYLPQITNFEIDV
ncbi:hypothetical protein [Parasitella parasitica]|uniref:Galactose oxidase n=1 Tax=Parasitella parasitica TaxID=35722 RepID=A0A0B7N940_9FUNG|nr:hypothetical protein [Parasitella parasitica]